MTFPWDTDKFIPYSKRLNDATQESQLQANGTPPVQSRY